MNEVIKNNLDHKTTSSSLHNPKKETIFHFYEYDNEWVNLLKLF